VESKNRARVQILYSKVLLIKYLNSISNDIDEARGDRSGGRAAPKPSVKNQSCKKAKKIYTAVGPTCVRICPVKKGVLNFRRPLFPKMYRIIIKQSSK